MTSQTNKTDCDVKGSNKVGTTKDLLHMSSQTNTIDYDVKRHNKVETTRHLHHMTSQINNTDYDVNTTNDDTNDTNNNSICAQTFMRTLRAPMEEPKRWYQKVRQ